ncbi:emopamil binding protein [Botrytis cinerea]
MSSIMEHIDQTTILSLLGVVAILLSSYILSVRVLSPTTPSSLRILFIWHFFDFLIHTIFEGSFLYNCFFLASPSIRQLLIREYVYGAQYADNWASKLWMVYAQADRRWAGADLTVVSLELLTVLGAGPLALWICWGIVRKDWRVNFWMVVLATGELYGGFMTFAPEWLIGCKNLDTSNFMFKWVYLVFFNTLWVFLPIYAMYVAFYDIGNAMKLRNGVINAKVEMMKREKKN